MTRANQNRNANTTSTGLPVANADFLGARYLALQPENEAMLRGVGI
jgi:hypothetical protein